VGRDPFLNKSLISGDPIEGYPVGGIWVEDVAFDDDVIDNTPINDDNVIDNAPVNEDDVIENNPVDDNVIHNTRVNDGHDIVNIPIEDAAAEPLEDQRLPPLDEYHKVQRQVMEALDRGDALHEEAEGSREPSDVDDGGDDTMDRMEDLYTQATTPLYEGSRTSVVSATIIIMNMCTVFRVSNKFTDELFRFLSVDLLPVGNKLPSTHYEARKSIH